MLLLMPVLTVVGDVYVMTLVLLMLLTPRWTPLRLLPAEAYAVVAAACGSSADRESLSLVEVSRADGFQLQHSHITFCISYIT